VKVAPPQQEGPLIAPFSTGQPCQKLDDETEAPFVRALTRVPVEGVTGLGPGYPESSTWQENPIVLTVHSHFEMELLQMNYSPGFF
jgi:hypothetical protein